MIRFILRAASTLGNTAGEQRTLHKFSANFTCQFIRVCLVYSTVYLRSFHVPTPREFNSNFPDVVFPPMVELEELTIFCVLNGKVAGFT